MQCVVMYRTSDWTRTSPWGMRQVVGGTTADHLLLHRSNHGSSPSLGTRQLGSQGKEVFVITVLLIFVCRVDLQ
jgi:hypothetical protein